MWRFSTGVKLPYPIRSSKMFSVGNSDGTAPIMLLDITFGYKLMNESRLLRKPRFFYTIDTK